MTTPAFVGRVLPLASYSKFRRLSITHAAMMGADAAMVVALADSLFFSIDPSTARDRVFLFLVVSFAPFLLIAPLIGPALDRVAGGRRAVIQFVGASRIVLSLLMVAVIDNVTLFPLVFAALVLQKTYLVCKSAIVPSVVRTERDLVEANSKLGLISGVVGFAVVIPAAILQVSPLGSAATLLYAAVMFSAALLASTFLSADVVAREAAGPAEQVQLHSQSVIDGSIVMLLLRGAVGFVLFLIAFFLREQDASNAWFGVALSAAAFGAISGNAVATRIRSRLSEELMLVAALGVSTGAGVAVALLGGIPALVLLAFCVNFAGSVGRLGFEAMLQRDAPSANRGRAFANFETRFQFAWAAAGVFPVVITISDQLGALVVGIACAGGIAYTVLRPRLASRSESGSGRPQSRIRDSRRPDDEI